MASSLAAYSPRLVLLQQLLLLLKQLLLRLQLHLLLLRESSPLSATGKRPPGCKAWRPAAECAGPPASFASDGAPE